MFFVCLVGVRGIWFCIIIFLFTEKDELVDAPATGLEVEVSRAGLVFLLLEVVDGGEGGEGMVGDGGGTNLVGRYLR